MPLFLSLSFSLPLSLPTPPPPPPSGLQVQKPVWGMLLQDRRAVQLFQEMKKIPKLRALLHGCREVTVYTLEE